MNKYFFIFFEPCVRCSEEYFDQTIQVTAALPVLYHSRFGRLAIDYKVEGIRTITRGAQVLVREVVTVEEVCWVKWLLPSVKTSSVRV